MKRLAWLLALALSAVPALAQDKDKDKKDKKKDDKKAAPAPTAADLIAEAETKATAGDADGAVEVLRKAVGMEGPAAADASLRLGKLLESRFEVDNAIDAYKAAADKLTGAAKGEALGRQSVAEGLRGMGEAASTTAEAATAADASGVWPTIALSRARARQGMGDEAIALAEKAGAAGGGAAAQAALGFAQEAKGDLAAAETAYRGALAADAKSASSTLGLARVLRKTGRAAEAVPLLTKVIADAPGAIEAYKESARVKMALNRPQDAMGDAATAAAMAENDADAQALVQEVTVASSLAEAAQGKTDLAVQDLTALRDKNPQSAVARLGLGKALILQRQPDPALVELKKAVELDPKNAEAWYQIGYASHVLKQNAAGALPAYEKAVEADPGNATYRTNLGAVLAETGQAERAVTELTKVTTSPGYNRAEAWIYLGGAQLGQKKYKEAIDALNKAVAIAPQAGIAEAYLAWSYFGLKDAAGFKEHGAKARTLGWKDAQLLDRLKRVEGGEVIK